MDLQIIVFHFYLPLPQFPNFNAFRFCNCDIVDSILGATVQRALVIKMQTMTCNNLAARGEGGKEGFYMTWQVGDWLEARRCSSAIVHCVELLQIIGHLVSDCSGQTGYLHFS